MGTEVQLPDPCLEPNASFFVSSSVVHKPLLTLIFSQEGDLAILFFNPRSQRIQRIFLKKKAYEIKKKMSSLRQGQREASHAASNNFVLQTLFVRKERMEEMGLKVTQVWMEARNA